MLCFCQTDQNSILTSYSKLLWAIKYCSKKLISLRKLALFVFFKLKYKITSIFKVLEPKWSMSLGGGSGSGDDSCLKNHFDNQLVC